MGESSAFARHAEGFQGSKKLCEVALASSEQQGRHQLSSPPPSPEAPLAPFNQLALVPLDCAYCLQASICCRTPSPNKGTDEVHPSCILCIYIYNYTIYIVIYTPEN